MGGYYEGDQEGGELKEDTANWDNDKRDCISTYQTVLSAKTEVKEGSAVNQEGERLPHRVLRQMAYRATMTATIPLP